jgi:hypothetical protein
MQNARSDDEAYTDASIRLDAARAAGTQPTVEERLAMLEAQVAAHRSALDIYPKLATWCESVEKDIKTVFENGQKLKAAIEIVANHSHTIVPAVQYGPVLFLR